MSNSNRRHKRTGVEILVRGTVQGVGFRPFVYNLASRFSVTGTVINTGDGVVIQAIAENDLLNTFIKAISEESPPLSRLTSVDSHPFTFDVTPEGFTILASSTTDAATTSIPPDIALCDDCYNELLDPADRRFLYPFINCTNCGPRFTIVETIPYDRPKTSMKVFPMCPACEKEYHNPADRRFHAQPNGCPECGPDISWHNQNGAELEVGDVIAAAAKSLADNKVVAIRGLGGFHLAVNGCSKRSVSLLRKRKSRPDKPLAIMVANSTILQDFCHFNDREKKLLFSPEHPIVLLKRKADSKLAPNLAPGIDDIGVMLPYTPLHHLLFREKKCPSALVMTSGNASGTPICTGNKDALKRLHSIADCFLLHNRDIVTRVDDSVVKMIDQKPLIFRRARGFAPSPVTVPWQLPKILGCGAGLKSTFCLAREKSSFLSQHIGDLSNLESYDFYTESIDHLKSVFQIEP
ncbi:MAG: carbamoyltransferase HypF, partial [Desulfobulbaceae bacterium S3730MH12]